MTRAGGLGTLILAWGCVSASATPKPAGDATTPSRTRSPFAATDCGAGHLPRITERTVADGGGQRFLSLAARGSVAAAWDGARARLVEQCHLDGRYTEARGQPGGGRFFATNRVMFRADEIDASCRTATHVIAAYVTSSEAGAPRLDGILVPLPCPPTSDREPAAGCLGMGMTGPQRRRKAEALIAKLDPDAAGTADVTRPLEIYALFPDDLPGLGYAARTNMGDCPLLRQGEWLMSQYRIGGGAHEDLQERAVLLPLDKRPAAPSLVWNENNHSCDGTPVFLTCFGDRFVPVFFAGKWQPPFEKRP